MLLFLRQLCRFYYSYLIAITPSLPVLFAERLTFIFEIVCPVLDGGTAYIINLLPLIDNFFKGIFLF